MHADSAMLMGLIGDLEGERDAALRWIRVLGERGDVQVLYQLGDLRFGMGPEPEAYLAAIDSTYAEYDLRLFCINGNHENGAPLVTNLISAPSTGHARQLSIAVIKRLRNEGRSHLRRQGIPARSSPPLRHRGSLARVARDLSNGETLRPARANCRNIAAIHASNVRLVGRAVAARLVIKLTD